MSDHTALDQNSESGRGAHPTPTKRGQVTPKTALEALRWVENTAHHRAAWSDDWKTLTLYGRRSDKLILHEPTWLLVKDLIEPGSSFDTRMFRANEAGLVVLRDGDTKLSSTATADEANDMNPSSSDPAQ